jgi:hypothetical protein
VRAELCFLFGLLPPVRMFLQEDLGFIRRDGGGLWNGVERGEKLEPKMNRVVSLFEVGRVTVNEELRVQSQTSSVKHATFHS